MSTVVNPDKYFEFKPSFTSFDNNQWRKGGMTCNGLKETTQAVNYFYGPGRQNLIPDSNPTADFKSDNPSFKPSVSSIGLVQNNGLGQLASGSSGPGTLLSTNLSVKNPSGLTDAQIGVVQSTPNKINFVDYRSTDPALVENLRKNPLSIYAQGENVKNSDIPAFFADIKPEDYSDYIRQPEIHIDDETKELYIDGSPNVTILGLAEQNPFMGLGLAQPNSKPEFLGKVYGGNNSGDARQIAENIYNQGWTNNMDQVEQFSSGMNQEMCQNKALSQFAQGYNVAPQIVENKIIIEGPHSANNLPWGPVKVTGNPRTQQGGIWQRGNNAWPTEYNPLGIQNTNVQNNGYKPLPPKRFINPYKNGLPGTLVP